MNFLAVLKRKIGEFSEEEIAKYLEPEAEQVRALYSQGVFRAVWSRGGPIKGAVVQMECADEEEAKNVIASLPFSKRGFLDCDIIPLLPYRGFGPRNS
jgi:muconolactone delta-isomerase